MSSNALSYYLGVGLAADRPSGAEFGSAETGFYYATDTLAWSGWNGAAWIDFIAGTGPSSAKSANFTTTSGVADYFVDTSGGAVTVTLNATPAVNEEVTIWDSGGAAGTNAISFAGGGHNIAGVSTLADFIAVNYGAAKLKWNGTQWLIR